MFGDQLALREVSRAAALTREERVVMASLANDRKPASLPAPNSDFYELVETLPAEELAVVKHFRNSEGRMAHDPMWTCVFEHPVDLSGRQAGVQRNSDHAEHAARICKFNVVGPVR